MKTVQINLYKFNELSDEAKQTAIDNLSDINTGYEWWENVYEDAKSIGLKITSFELYRSRGAEGEFMLSASAVAQNILNNHGENCETFKTAAKFMEEFTPIFSDYMNEESEGYESRENEDRMLDLENDFLRNLLEEYAVMLEKEVEWLQSDEAIIETIEANDYDFTEDGKLY